MTTLSAEIRRGRKFDQVLAGARMVFLRDGYEGASVDDIAREAGVSKATLYSYFPDKRLLFLEVAQAECLRQADEAMAVISDNTTPFDVLTYAGRQIASFILSDFGVQMYRIVVAESARFPDLGRAFYQTGPQAVRSVMADYLRAAVARGDLVVPDVDLAADQFFELCKADLLHRLLFGLDTQIPARDVSRTITGAVEMFLARYGVRP